MTFQGKAVLVYLEEDNIARSFFRIRPLMTQDGPIGAEIAAEFPDEGYLRIVPDKNEQHTFKERMRSLCGPCLMDLRYQPADANKIRTNKNYSPARGEINQYIIYSDAIHALPDDMLYQVVSADERNKAITPFVYIRNGANIQGPFKKETDASSAEGSILPPDSTELHVLAMPNGPEILIYWPKKTETAPAVSPASETDAHQAIPAEAAASPAASVPPADGKAAPAAPEKPTTINAHQQIQEMNVSLSESANLLRSSASAVSAPVNNDKSTKPLSGTRLYQAPQQSASPRRAHNSLMEIVDNQRYAAKYEAPGAVLPQNAELKDVSNPVDAFKRALQGLWQSTEAQQQAIDVLLSQPSMKAMLSKSIAANNGDATLAAMKTQLQELEAERLMILMQLDDAKKNLADFREEALSELIKVQQKKIKELTEAELQAQKAAEDARQALESLNTMCRDAAEKLGEIQKPFMNPDHTLFLSPAVGKAVSKDELIKRIESSMTAAGFLMRPGDALEMLTAYALSDSILEIRAQSECDALSAYHAFANALGSKIHKKSYKWDAHVLDTGDAPLFIHFSDYTHPLVTNVYIASTCNDYSDYRGEECRDYSWASLIVEPSQEAIPTSLPSFTPVSKACILKETIKESSLHQETLDLIRNLRLALHEAGRPLPLHAVKTLCRFIACTQNALPGGVAEAIDRAVCVYAVPHIQTYKLPADKLKNLLAAMPRTLKALNIV